MPGPGRLGLLTCMNRRCCAFSARLLGRKDVAAHGLRHLLQRLRTLNELDRNDDRLARLDRCRARKLVQPRKRRRDGRVVRYVRCDGIERRSGVGDQGEYPRIKLNPLRRGRGRWCGCRGVSGGLVSVTVLVAARSRRISSNGPRKSESSLRKRLRRCSCLAPTGVVNALRTIAALSLSSEAERSGEQSQAASPVFRGRGPVQRLFDGIHRGECVIYPSLRDVCRQHRSRLVAIHPLQRRGRTGAGLACDGIISRQRRMTRLVTLATMNPGGSGLLHHVS